MAWLFCAWFTSNARRMTMARTGVGLKETAQDLGIVKAKVKAKAKVKVDDPTKILT